jgi:microcystin-dependent protein
MSSATVDNYFPFTNGPGSAATQDNWRLMARNWVQGGSGIIAGYKNQFKPTISGTSITVDTGAAWLDGFYGENTAAKTVTATGNGMVVVQMDPTPSTGGVINIAFKVGQSKPVQQSTGVFEIPIATVAGSGLTDARQYVVTTASILVPTGVMVPFAGSAVPIGWLFCDGTAVSRASYPALWSTVGTTFGSGDGTTTFNLPDTRSRMVVGAAPSAPTGLTQRLLGAVGGSEAITTNQMPAHNHALQYSPAVQSIYSAIGLTPSGGLNMAVFDTHPTQNSGGGQPFYPPYIALNQIIKT